MINKQSFATRGTLKAQAKKLIKDHSSYFILVYLPSALLMIVEYLLSRNWCTYTPHVSELSLTVEFFANAALLGATLVSIQALRTKDDFKNPIQKSFGVVTSSSKLSGFVMINSLRFIFLLGWAFLLIIPAFIKAIAYSQAYYIYQDHLSDGHPIGYREAISESRVLMKGRKADYFVLVLSFIGWELLNMLTLGITNIWINPYIQTTFAAFYVDLVKVKQNDPKLETVVD